MLWQVENSSYFPIHVDSCIYLPRQLWRCENLEVIQVLLQKRASWLWPSPRRLPLFSTYVPLGGCCQADPAQKAYNSGVSSDGSRTPLTATEHSPLPSRKTMRNAGTFRSLFNSIPKSTDIICLKTTRFPIFPFSTLQWVYLDLTIMACWLFLPYGLFGFPRVYLLSWKFIQNGQRLGGSTWMIS